MVSRAVKHADRLQIVERSPARPAFDADPTRCALEARQSAPLREVLCIVPVVELVFEAGWGLHGHKEQALRTEHWSEFLQSDILASSTRMTLLLAATSSAMPSLFSNTKSRKPEPIPREPSLLSLGVAAPSSP